MAEKATATPTPFLTPTMTPTPTSTPMGATPIPTPPVPTGPVVRKAERIDQGKILRLWLDVEIPPEVTPVEKVIYTSYEVPWGRSLPYRQLLLKTWETEKRLPLSLMRGGFHPRGRVFLLTENGSLTPNL